MPAVRRFQFKIAPNTPLKDLLPVPPQVKKTRVPALTEDLAQVPEVQFQTPMAKDLPGEEATKQTAHQIAKINHLNAKKTDAFMEALSGERLDLAGLPFAMGHACRTTGERSRQFATAVATVRGAMQQRFAAPPPPPLPSGPGPGAQSAQPVTQAVAEQGSARQGTVSLAQSAQPVALAVASPPPVFADVIPAERFWDQYQAACVQEDKGVSRIDRDQCEHTTLARIAPP